MLKYYLELLGYFDMPEFIVKYLKCPSLIRLKDVGYFCGMDYASKDIYDFREYISRFDHSLTVALIVYKLTCDKKATIAGLFHDIATPCFSHVIDYMNKDHEKQESTEEYTELIIRNDTWLCHCLEEDGIDLRDIVDFKKYSIVDNDRPKACADRIDGVVLTGIGWTKNISKNDIKNIVMAMRLFKNENEELEIGFNSLEAAKLVLKVSESIDSYCHSKEDFYMMELLAKITKYAIDMNIICYDDLYKLNEKELFNILEESSDLYLKELIMEFKTKKKEDIEDVKVSNVKIRDLNPLVNGERLRLVRTRN